MKKEELIKVLNKIRMDHMCGYIDPNFCDCKFSDLFRMPLRQRGEQTGCPEMRTLIEFIEALPETEF